MNIASIDIGTNTVLMLISEIDIEKKAFKPIQNYFEIPRLGKDLIKGGEIKNSRIENLHKVFEKYSVEIKKYNCSKVIAAATSAMRIASNSNKIINEIKSIYGIEIKVISGTEEAMYSYLGAISTIEAENYVVIDIGGGSTEIIFGTKNQIKFSKSFFIGAVNLTEEYFKNNPPSENEINSAEEKIKNVFKELSEFNLKDFTAIAVAGTPTSLSCIKQNISEYDEIKVEKSILTNKDLINLSDYLSRINSNELLKKFPGVVKGREDILFAGTLILKNLSQIMNLEETVISTRGIRYGLVIDFLHNI